MAASLRGAGAISAQFYAERLFYLPHTLIAVSVGSVLLPFVLRDAKAGRNATNRLIIYALLVMGPITVLWLLFAPQIVTFALEHGRFSHGASEAVASVLSGYAIGLAPLFVVTLGWRVLTVRSKIRHVIAVPAVFLGVLGVTAIPLLTVWGLFGLGVAHSLSALVAMVIVVWLTGGLKYLAFVRLARGFFAVTVALVAMTAIGWAVRTMPIAPLLQLGIGGTISLISYVATLAVLGVLDLRQVFRFGVRAYLPELMG
jgi:putative peptidoglycan lipid II flippase